MTDHLSQTQNQSGARGLNQPVLDVSKLSVEAVFSKLIDYALTMKASDLFIGTEESDVTVSMRALGIIQPVATLGAEQGRRLAAHIKATAGIDLNERRRPMDGRWIYQDSDGTPIDIRINALPTIFGEDLALRILSRDNRLLELESLGLIQQQYEQVLAMLGRPGGLILITGPTGSGKTATLYACLRRLSGGEKKINTIEDPVEYILPGVRQSSVNPSQDITFAELLRSVLRQSPDVIMIGEVRDKETALTAVHAANSGQLVLATVHASHAAAAIQSMRSLGVVSQFLATSLRGVIAQRLVRTICPACKKGYDLSDAPHTFEEVRKWLHDGEGRQLWTAPGCDVCGHTGYGGQTGVFEVLPITHEIRAMIADGQNIRAIHEQALLSEMLTFRQTALLKVAQGLTTAEEVFRVVPPEQMDLDE